MKLCILSLILSIFFCSLYAQNSRNSRKIETLYNNAKEKAQAGDTGNAIELLFQILKLDSSYYQARFALADIYHETAKTDLEIENLRSGLRNSGNNFAPAFKFLAQALYYKGIYDEAFENIRRYEQIKKSLDPQEMRLLKSCSFAKDAIKNPVPFHPENIGDGVNTEDDEYWPCLDAEGKQLIFTRLLRYSSDGQKLPFPQEDLFRSVKDSVKWQNSVPIASINTPENEGAQCISADGRLLFFTACGRPDGKGSCDIYMSVRKNGNWSQPVNLGVPVNSGAWETQPSVSADGHFLYFTSNRSGGKGKMDIWRAEKIGITSDGFPAYGKVINMEGINTGGDELSPFIHADGKTLYFSSDYWPGMGGKDLFCVNLENDKTSIPVNLGYPINTPADEVGLIVDTEGENAFFNSNKAGGRDIYSFSLPQNVQPGKVSYIKGKVFDKKTGTTLLPDIHLFDLANNLELQHIYPSENEGEFLLCLPLGKNYGLTIEKTGYLFCSRNFNLEHSYSKAKPLDLSIGLDPIEPGKVTRLDNIFFETDSFSLKSESKPQLNEMFTFLTSNPGWIVEIGGHTDNKGSESYNIQLSEKRAAAVVHYLIERGIPYKRLRSKGYGFSKPVADNSTEEGRGANRRTEFKIVETEK
jgi:outer membrane protein OmpA-like peptidoglycan-associated protein